MNKQEAIETLQDVAQGVFYRTGSCSVYIDKIVEVVNQIYEPQKVVIPKFVADYIELNKGWSEDGQEYIEDDSSGLWFALDGNSCGMPNSVSDWLFNDEKVETFARAWLDGYEIEKEKLYTVEIPNPNSAGGKLVLFKQQSSGRLILDILNHNINKPKYLHLTESEIKQDFDFLWQFAKEVE